VGAPVTSLSDNDTWTRDELLRARGMVVEPVEASTGREAEASPALANGNGSNPEPAARVCPGCGVPITGHVSKLWCSPSCRKRHQKPQVSVTSVGTAPLARAPQAPLQGDILAEALALAVKLPPGGRLELSAGELCLRWAP
jgi:hypothetical protein